MGSDRLVLLPGLGADAELLAPQRREFPDLEVQPTEVVHGGGHFINVTHADQVNVCVRRAIEDA